MTLSQIHLTSPSIPNYSPHNVTLLPIALRSVDPSIPSGHSPCMAVAFDPLQTNDRVQLDAEHTAKLMRANDAVHAPAEALQFIVGNAT